MVRERTPESTPSADRICAVLVDPDCREIIRTLEEPLTTPELRERCDIPKSTLYRKLELLTEATLLEESLEVRRNGRHTSKYELNFEEVTLSLDEERSIGAQIDRPAKSADVQLAGLWSEVRKET